jgi:hypothetical protein
MRSWLLAAAGAAIVLSAFVWGPAVRHRIRMLYLQHQCMSHTAPPTQIVFTDDPVEMPKLITVGPPYRYAPGNWHKVGVARDLVQWRQLWVGGECGTIFCHRLKSPAGHERLVGVDMVFDDEAPELVAVATVLAPGYPLTPPSQRVAPLAPGFAASLGAGTTTIYAGQIDPADASHFTFIYRHRDKDMLIDGWLNDDDSVSMHERRPGSPLTRPSLAARSNP